MRVVKLGGSLLTAQALPACLDAIARWLGRVVIVPGGGPFADQVRQTQRQWGFDDDAAHRMAILAMQQMAILIASMKPEFALCGRLEAFSDAAKVTIWSPDPDQLDRAGIAASWDVTSDSLAAWLAGRLQAEELLLVKSCAVESGNDFGLLQQRGVIDAAFRRFADQAQCKIRIIDKDCFLALI